MDYMSVVLWVWVLLVSFKIQRNYGQDMQNFFRQDYIYSDAAKSFYKFHPTRRTWFGAKRKCALEGASLFYPEDEAEAATVMSIWNTTQTLTLPFAYIGISDLSSFKGEFETIDGKPLSTVYSNWDVNEPNDADGKEDCLIMTEYGALNDELCTRQYPFICKKSQKSLQWNSLCEMPDPGYQYNHAQGKCYKFHLNPRNWTDAYSICLGEQSYLAVPNSKSEADLLVKITAEAPKDNVKGKYVKGAVHLGFHDLDEEGWITLLDVKLEDNGYSTWGNKQPDGGDSDRCGSMYYNGRLNDLGCQRKCFFICEHDIGSLSASIDDRFGVE